MEDPSCVFAGIEGGGTHSKIVLIHEDGRQLYWKDMPGTNYHQIGREKFAQVVELAVILAKNAINIDPNTRLGGLGLAMSGAEDEIENKKLIDFFSHRYPNTAEHYYLASDSIGTISTSLQNGGAVLIAGTGSTCRLLNPNGSIHFTGGWGHMIGDQASGFWIAMEAVKTVFNDEEGLYPCPFDTTKTKALIFDHFHMTQLVGILEDMYAKFEKQKIAGLCVKLAECATHGDFLCRDIFRRAGFDLGRHVVGVCRNADKSFLSGGELPIVTVGSVWKSFELLKTGFLDGLQPRYQKDASISRIRLFELTASPAIGAAVLAAKVADRDIRVDFAKNAKEYFQADL